MANLIESTGYSLGKVHVGLFSYLCDLYRDGTIAPLKSILQALDIPVPHRPVPYREWKAAPKVRLDLAIFDGDAHVPTIIIEMKVDDCESNSDDVWQTMRYAAATPDVPHRLFVTLGHGEYYHPPYDKRFRWVGLHEFTQAVRDACAVHPDDDHLRDWAAALQNELNRRDAVANNARQQLTTYRPGSWNINFLGQLKESLMKELGATTVGIDPTCYTYGTRPDTILNFGWHKYPRYTEINNNGRLNVKICFDDCDSDADRRALYEQTTQLLRNDLGIRNEDLRAYNAGSRSMTIVSLAIGLAAPDGALEYIHGQDHTVKELAGYLSVLYA